ncbi:MAG: flavodoxin family protein [Christensenellales bacterium]|jgi:flavodoxin
MKKAVVFYSHDGSTKVAAEVIAKKYGADIFEIEEVKKRGHSGLAFVGAAFGAVFGKKSRIKSTFAQELKRYEDLFIGTPVWAGKSAPAVNTFVDALDASGKKIVIFTVQADKKPDKLPAKCADIIKNKLEDKGSIILKIARLWGAPPGKTVEIKDIQKQIDEKIC